jgi:hypothetical protein
LEPLMLANDLFCRPLSDDDQEQIGAALGSLRLRRFGELTDALRRPAAAAALGPGQEALRRFFEGALTLGDRDPAGFLELVTHWVPTFLLERLEEALSEGGAPPSERLFDSLDGLLDRRWPPAGGAAGPVRAQRWGLPCFDDVEALGLERFRPDPGDPRYRAEDGWTALPFAEGLDRAHDLLAELWPEEIAWLTAMVPAFVDMGGPPSRWVHRSGSYGAGSPIVLSKVDDPFKHAEDLVHELQHERFNLLADVATLPCWNDRRQIYVSPYRSDPRPLRGVLLGIHAFVAVNELRLRAAARGVASDKLAERLLNTHLLNLFAFRTLHDHERFEGDHRRLFADLAGTLVRHHPAVFELAPPGAMTSCHAAITRHAERLRGVAGIRNLGPEVFAWTEIAELAAVYTSACADASGVPA